MRGLVGSRILGPVGSDMAGTRGISSTVHSLSLTVSVGFLKVKPRALLDGCAGFLGCYCWMFIPCRQSVGGACVGVCQLFG